MRYSKWLSILVLLVVAPFVLPPFYLFLVSEMLIWSLFALSFNLLYGCTGLLSLGQSVYFGLGAYGVALMLIYGLPNLELALFVGILSALIGAGLVGVFAIRARGHGFIILTAVTALSMYLLILNLSPITGGDNGRTFTLPTLFGLNLTDRVTIYGVIAIITSVVIFSLTWLLKTPLGLAWKLIRENESRAAELGYNTQALKWTAFLFSGTLAGLSGALFAVFDRFVEAKLFHWFLSADVIVWTLFGGAGTLWGPVLGTFSFKLLEEALSQWWSTGQPLLLGIALIVVVRFFPEGLMGTWLQRKTRNVSK